MLDQINIRQEQEQDFGPLSDLIYQAFKGMHEHPTEANLVRSLRANNAHIPALCLVAENDQELIGHIFFTNLKVEYNEAHAKLLALAPVSVLPNYQGQGIGSALINRSIFLAKSLNYDAIVLVGHEDYYPRFGFDQLSTTDIKLPFEVPDKNAMILKLSKKVDDVSGMLTYDKAFFS